MAQRPRPLKFGPGQAQRISGPKPHKVKEFGQIPEPCGFWGFWSLRRGTLLFWGSPDGTRASETKKEVKFVLEFDPARRANLKIRSPSKFSRDVAVFKRF